MSSVNLQEMLEKLQSGEIESVSALKLRDENIQVKDRVSTIPRLKREIKKNSKLLFQTELAIPFNPFTGKPDDQYNANRKFRPLVSETSITKTLKLFYNQPENAEVKALMMKKAGLENWDTSNQDTITEEDRMIFRKYRVPRMFTLPVVHINIPILTSSQFGRDYTIKVVRNEETGMIEGTWPAPLRANKLFNDMAYEEIEELKEKDKLSASPKSEKDMNDEIKKIFGKIPVSSDYPMNYVLAFELAVDGKYNIKDAELLEEMATEDVYAKLVLVKCTKEILAALEKYQNGSYEAIDVYNDFWEFDMNCPTETGLDAMLIGKNTRYEKPMNAVKNHKFFSEFNRAVIEYLDNAGDLEKIFLRSVKTGPFDENVEAKFLDALHTVIDVDSPYLTSKVIMANADFLTEVLGEDGDILIANAEVGLKEEGKLDEKEADKIAKSINIEELQKGEDVVTDEVELGIEQ